MSKSFYPKLAVSNIKKNGKTYIPYLFAAVFSIVMFYIMTSLATNETIQEMPRGENLVLMLRFGTIIIGIFSVLILFYANSFVMKRRKKELGLYNILGMEKRHIVKLLFVETIFSALFSMIVGLLTGMLLSKLLFLVLLKIINFTVSLQFNVSILALLMTIAVFTLIFLIVLLYNVVKVRITNPINLLKGGQQGEKEPKTKWLLACIGFVALGVAYFIALTIESPLAAFSYFFIAVLLVIVGTYCLFIAGSIAILKMLRKNKEIYYKSRNFTAISGMLYRMKQHAAGLASICILSTMVLVTISTTVSLYVGQEDILHTRFPREFQITKVNPTEENIEKIEEAVKKAADEHGTTLENLTSFTNRSAIVIGSNGKFVEATDTADQMSFSALVFIEEEAYHQLTGETSSLGDNEVLLYSERDYLYDTLEFDGKTLTIVDRLDFHKEFETMMEPAIDTMVVVVNDLANIQTIFPNNLAVFRVGFDTELEGETATDFASTLRNNLSNVDAASVTSRQEAKDDFLATFGGLFFLGFFLGTLFLMATGLIIYYKQISEGYEDKERFNIMQKVGMSKEEVKKTIRTQTLLVFFLPLIVAVIHLAFAFPVITKLLRLFALTNTTLFLICTVITILAFAGIYVILYRLTARTYYRIVSE